MIPLRGLHVFEAAPRMMDKLAAKDSPNNVTSLLVTPDIKVRQSLVAGCRSDHLNLVGRFHSKRYY